MRSDGGALYTQIEQQLPNFVQHNHSGFSKFIEKYYEFLEEQRNISFVNSYYKTIGFREVEFKYDNSRGFLNLFVNGFTSCFMIRNIDLRFDESMKDEIMVTVIATGFNRKSIVDDLIPNNIDSSEVKETETQILSEKENLPLYEKSKLEEQKEVENKPPMLFDDSKPTVYGNDLEVPAFIRRQHE